MVVYNKLAFHFLQHAVAYTMYMWPARDISPIISLKYYIILIGYNGITAYTDSQIHYTTLNLQPFSVRFYRLCLHPYHGSQYTFNSGQSNYRCNPTHKYIACCPCMLSLPANSLTHTHMQVCTQTYLHRLKILPVCLWRVPHCL